MSAEAGGCIIGRCACRTDSRRCSSARSSRCWRQRRSPEHPAHAPRARTSRPHNQLNAAHDGYQTASLATPLTKAWSVTLPGPVSYPLIVNGTVYVTARDAGSGTSLYALNQASGTTLWSRQLGGSYYWSALTYDAGQIFTINNSGLLSAFDAASGQTNWATSLPGYDFTSAPTAANGDVYVGGDGAVFAVTQATGQVV